MSLDFSGAAAPVPILGFKPRGGQWVRFWLTDPAKQAALIQEGCHAAPDGALVAIHQQEHMSAGVSGTRNGQPFTEPPQHVPAMLVLVDARGNNFATGVRDPQTGHVEVKNIFFYPSSPMVRDLAPCTSAAELPPGRVMHSRWLEAFHGQQALPDDVHVQHGHEMTPATFLQHHAALAAPSA